MINQLIKNVHVYNTFIQTFETKNVYVHNGKFYYISDDLPLEADEVIDGNGKYMIPGLIDIHMHIESSMTVPSEFSQAVLPHGVTTVVADPHEIANVFGIRGIEATISNETTLDIFYGIPSSVPSTNSTLETTGGVIDVADVKQLLKNPKIMCLGEVMNFKDLIGGDETLINQIIKACHESRWQLPIEGHCPRISGLDLAKYIYQGVDADHTHQTPESIVEKIKNGMFLEIQRKSINQATIDTLVKNNFYEYFAFVTDDVMADQLQQGHLNLLVKLAHDLNMPIEKAIYCATYTPARRMHMIDRGCIAPGKQADYVLLDDLDNFVISSVYKKGKCVFDRQRKIQIKDQPPVFPEDFYHSLHAKMATPQDFMIKSNQKEVTCHVMEIEPHSTFTKHLKMTLPVKDGYVDYQSAGLSLLTVFERYQKNGHIVHALVKNALTQAGAIATSWAHDHHNIMILGNDIDDMVMAQQQLLKQQGGYLVVRNKEVVANTPLKIGGIISDEPIEKLAASLSKVRKEMAALGYHHDNAIMSLSTLSLPVSPELKVTDFGLLDTHSQTIIPLMEAENDHTN